MLRTIDGEELVSIHSPDLFKQLRARLTPEQQQAAERYICGWIDAIPPKTAMSVRDIAPHHWGNIPALDDIYKLAGRGSTMRSALFLGQWLMLEIIKDGKWWWTTKQPKDLNDPESFEVNKYWFDG